MAECTVVGVSTFTSKKLGKDYTSVHVLKEPDYPHNFIGQETMSFVLSGRRTEIQPGAVVDVVWAPGKDGKAFVQDCRLVEE